MDQAQKKYERLPLYNSRLIDNYTKLIKRRYDYININELLRYANMEPYEVADQGHWFTQEQINRFHERLSQICHNPHIAREAGRYAASPDALGVMRQYALGMLGPGKIYEIIGKAAQNFTRSTHYSSHKIASNRVEISVTPRMGIREQPFQCENRMGFFESITLLFTGKLPTIDHPQCIHRGDPLCRYMITWEKTLALMLKPLVRMVAIPVVLGNLASLFLLPFHGFLLTAALSAVLFSGIMLLTAQMENRDLRSSLSSLRDSTDQLVEQININYTNSRLTSEVGLTLSRHLHMEDILENVIQIFRKWLSFDRCLILMADADEKQLRFQAGYGYKGDQYALLRKTAFHLDHPDSRGIFVVAYRKRKPFLINNINEIHDDLSPRSLSFAKKLGSKSFICCPILSEGKAIGILAVDNLSSKRPLVQSDVSLLMGIASALGISIRNAELIQGRERQFASILKALAASIDARDPMTSGHSEKVTEHALGICKEMGLSKDFCEVIRVAALLHDYGKIGVPDAILKKPGRLTPTERELVKSHVVKTKEILSKINFEGEFSQVPAIAGAHHEKFDGSGYPAGLQGEAIPLGARIIAVADFFEAITSRRHYHEPISSTSALRMLRQKAGVDFDLNVIDAFCTYYAKTHSHGVIASAGPPLNLPAPKPAPSEQTPKNLRVSPPYAHKS